VGERGVERVAADDLVEVWGRDGVGGYEGVQALDDELGALEAEHGGDDELGGGMVNEEGEDEVMEMHGIGGDVNEVVKIQ
jgi:hypothetical protein